MPIDCEQKNLISGHAKFNITSCPLYQKASLSTEVILLLTLPVKALILVATLGIFLAPEYTAVQQCQIH